MNAISILIVALLPVAILMWYIFNKDTEKEPVKELLIAFGFGTLSVLLSFAISIPFGKWGLYVDVNTSIMDAVRDAFFGAAIPEEIAKFVMLWLFMRRCKEYDQYMDGIVYAVCISLGFAAIENIMYVADGGMSTGIYRALTAVPGHYCDGVLMGYYYSKVRLGYGNSFKDKVMVLLAPIIVHGIYDAIVMSGSVLFDNDYTMLGMLFVPLFIYFIYKMHKYCSKRIEDMIEQDRLDIALRDGGKEE